jgi:Lrp/AsnC family transcriptional regulator, leucine-responsive regulatory protein
MKRKAKIVRQNERRRRELDAFDRKILGVLVEDAGVSYAKLGDRIGLSAPAVHERVKRMRRSGVIRRTAALIDAAGVGKPYLAFVLVDVRGWCWTPEFLAVANLPEVEEVHSVAGDTGMLLKVRTEDSRALEGLLARIYDAPGVVTTRTYVVLSTHLERPAQADSTVSWPPPRQARGKPPTPVGQVSKAAGATDSPLR